MNMPDTNVWGMWNGTNTHKQATKQSIQKGEKLNMTMNFADGTSLQYEGQTCQHPIAGISEHLVKTSQWRESVPDSGESDHPLFKKFFGSIGKPQKKIDPHTLSTRMLKACFLATEDETFSQSSLKWNHWGLLSNGECLTANTGEFHKIGNVFSRSEQE